MPHNASPLSSLVVGDGDRPHVPVDDHISFGGPPATKTAACFNCYAIRWIRNTFQVSQLFFSPQILWIGQWIVASHKNFEHGC